MISEDLVEVFSRGGGASTEQEPEMALGRLVIAAVGQRGVDFSQHGGGAGRVRAHDNAIGMEEVGDSRSFAQELWVRNDVEHLAGDAIALDDAANPLVGVHRHGALLDDHLVAGDVARDLAGDGFHIGKVGIARFGLRRADGDEDRLAARW